MRSCRAHSLFVSSLALAGSLVACGLKDKSGSKQEAASPTPPTATVPPPAEAVAPAPQPPAAPSDPAASAPETVVASPAAAGSGSDGGNDEAQSPEEAARFDACAAAADGMAIAKITDFIALVNKLPRPTTLSCVLAALPRPLAVVAAQSPLSAQQSPDETSPRIFVKYGPVILTLLLANGDRDTIEASELVGDGANSVKADFPYFPLKDGELLTEAGAYDHLVKEANRTECAACHEREVKYGNGYPETAFVSEGIRPNSDWTLKPEKLKAYFEACGNTVTPRCARYRALFRGGEPGTWAFPEVMREVR